MYCTAKCVYYDVMVCFVNTRRLLAVSMAERQNQNKRKPNWFSSECLLLAQLVLERNAVIRGKFGSGVTAKAKKDACASVADALNSSFPLAEMASFRRVAEVISSRIKSAIKSIPALSNRYRFRSSSLYSAKTSLRSRKTLSCLLAAILF